MKKVGEAHFVIGLNIELNLLPCQGADSSKRSVQVIKRLWMLGPTHLINIFVEGSDAGRCVEVFAIVGTKFELGRLWLNGGISPERKVMHRSLVRLRYLALLESRSLAGWKVLCWFIKSAV